jgi:hypothetical protein
VTHRRVVDQRTAGGLARHVDRGKFGFAVTLRDALHRGFALAGIAPGQHDDGTGRGETLRHAEPDTAVAAGDDGNAV